MKIVAVTSCPTGIAHTYMAAEALEQAAKDAGHEIKVETQGAAGAEAVVLRAHASLRDRRTQPSQRGCDCDKTAPGSRGA